MGDNFHDRHCHPHGDPDQGGSAYLPGARRRRHRTLVLGASRLPHRRNISQAGAIRLRELTADAAEIMLLSLADYEKPDLSARRPEGLWDAYIRMRGVHTLYDAIRGEAFIQTPIKRQPCGDWEFEVRDPNGYVIVFGGE